jgi:hypothetical protein
MTQCWMRQPFNRPSLHDISVKCNELIQYEEVWIVYYISLLHYGTICTRSWVISLKYLWNYYLSDNLELLMYICVYYICNLDINVTYKKWKSQLARQPTVLYITILSVCIQKDLPWVCLSKIYIYLLVIITWCILSI